MAMHSLSSRFNTMVLFTATVLAVMCALNYFSGLYLFRLVEPSKAEFEITGFRDFNRSPTFKWDSVLFKFNLTLNLKELHNWNLKQIFLWIQVDYVSPEGLNSSSIISDWIVQPSKQNQTVDHWDLEYNNTWADYPLRDVYNSLRNQEVSIKVMMEYMPHVGFFFKKQLKEVKYRMPEEYAKSG